MKEVGDVVGQAAARRAAHHWGGGVLHQLQMACAAQDVAALQAHHPFAMPGVHKAYGTSPIVAGGERKRGRLGRRRARHRRRISKGFCPTLCGPPSLLALLA